MTRKRLPHLLLVMNLRFSLDAILQWELANSVRGDAKELKSLPVALSRSLNRRYRPARRWHELVRDRDRERIDSAP